MVPGDQQCASWILGFGSLGQGVAKCSLAAFFGNPAPSPFPSALCAEMALKLLHRFCFIDVEECISFPEMPKEKSQRASSARPLSRPERRHDATMLSISALAQRAQQLHTMLRLKRGEAPVCERFSTSDSSATEASATAEEVATEQGTQETIFAEGQWPSPGSMGHPEICRRSCMHFIAGACSSGAQCQYCHLPHHHRPAHLDKRQRELLRSLSEPQLMALLLWHLEAKARTHGFLPEAAELLALLRHKGRLAPGQRPEPSPVPRKAWPKFECMIQKMAFQDLVGLAMKSRTSSQDFVDDLAAAMGRMRGTLLASE
ncbi:unnamed protein product [Effrenium voratum]|nr:unnamed protein product [Effrenium voratum]